jgi:hypothetical protein
MKSVFADKSYGIKKVAQRVFRRKTDYDTADSKRCDYRRNINAQIRKNNGNVDY